MVTFLQIRSDRSWSFIYSGTSGSFRPFSKLVDVFKLITIAWSTPEGSSRWFCELEASLSESKKCQWCWSAVVGRGQGQIVKLFT